MKRAILFILLFLSINLSLHGQLTNDKYLLLKHHRSFRQDTTSEALLEKHKDIEGLFVQLRESYEHTDLKIFQTVPELQYLSIQNNSMTSLHGLEALQELKRLSIFSNSIKDFSSLEQISQLKYFLFESNVPIDIPLEYSQLEDLTYSCNYDLSKCSFPKLKQINIYQVPTEDYDRDDPNYGVIYSLQNPTDPIALNHFDLLESVRIRHLEVENLNTIQFPKNLKKLTITECNSLVDVDQIKKLEKLESLNISFCNQINNFEFLRELDHVEWRIFYKGRMYTKPTLEKLLAHEPSTYYYADYDEVTYEDGSFYNFHPSVIENAKTVFKKYHQTILESNPTRKEFLDLISPLITELESLCTKDTCAISWDDEETDYLIYFLKDMAQVAGHKFEEGHFYRKMEDWY